MAKLTTEEAMQDLKRVELGLSFLLRRCKRRDGKVFKGFISCIDTSNKELRRIYENWEWWNVKNPFYFPMHLTPLLKILDCATIIYTGRKDHKVIEALLAKSIYRLDDIIDNLG
ncbi:MAG: hypothetical protein PHH69_04475 [Candidatus Omnitrophica bacterium]|nr:hypothetical protein [Candidatus Omnitrophota bacterium]